MKEHAISFKCGNENLIGILHQPGSDVTTGVLIIVGGPQYRVGSHRQFVLLARDLAALNFPVFRFDYRGMGDSEGDLRDFEKIELDIKAAIDAFIETCPKLTNIIIWGLCDAASAALFYAYTDERVKGLVLLNPWVRTETGEAKAYMKHYYLSRLTNPDLWRKIISGKFSLTASLVSFLSIFKKVIFGSSKTGGSAKAQSLFDQNSPLPDRLLIGLTRFQGNVLFILSGDDLTAAEFKDATKESEDWKKILSEDRISTYELDEANHTFSQKSWRDQVSNWTGQWMLSLK